MFSWGQRVNRTFLHFQTERDLGRGLHFWAQLILVEEGESKCERRRNAIWQSEQILGQKILPQEIRPTLRGSHSLSSAQNMCRRFPKTSVSQSGLPTRACRKKFLLTGNMLMFPLICVICLREVKKSINFMARHTFISFGPFPTFWPAWLPSYI